jgi:hypothetical protein
VHWQILDVPQDPKTHNLAVRLNALASLYYFSKIVLKRHRLSNFLHRDIASSLETENLHLMLEMPRDSMKSTLVTESLSMWWALPFAETDEAAMRELGYDDAWIRWMKHVHNPNTRTLIISENESNAIRFGRRIDTHYESNDVFRAVFPEILPNARCTWNDKSKTHKRTFSGQGEGTYDFLGVGGAVQSRHYDRIIEDDLVGREAKNSELVMGDTIEYHRLLSGVFDSAASHKTQLGEEVVVGNRWAYYDMNGWIREHEPEFAIETHSARGGCCDKHPNGIAIFPEELSLEKLAKIEARLSIEDFSHQYLNLAVLPGEQPFRPEWLKFYELYEGQRNGVSSAFLRHEVEGGKTAGDIPVSLLNRRLICDPNHAEEKGRAHHALVVVGHDAETDKQYLLDSWAKSSSYDELVIQIYKFAKRWRLQEFFLEKVAAQQLLRYPLEYRSKIEDYKLIIRYLDASRASNAKDDRIRAMEPNFRNGKFYCRRDQVGFIEEYKTYPSCRTKDILDALAYANSTFDNVRYRDAINAVATWNTRRKQAMAEVRS